MNERDNDAHSDAYTINVPEAELPTVPLTRAEIEEAAQERVSRISEEFAQGFRFIRRYPRSVTFFGSSRADENDHHYQHARALAATLADEGFAVVTGGGPGIMEAANRGASDAGGPSLGLNIRLPSNQATNPYVTESVDFYYFFSRKVALSFSAEAFIFFPGGFGTLDEFFELVTLVQTRKIPKVPLILVGSEYWERFDTYIRQNLLNAYETISPRDAELYTIVDDTEEICSIARNAPMRTE